MQRKRPLHGKIFARCIPKRLFAGLFGCMARISCQSQLILDTRRRYAATNWRFSRPRPLSGCMERKTCHGLPPGNAFREHFSIGKRPGTHRGEILPRIDTWGRTARVYCHCQSGQERISAQSRHRRTLGNASREHFAIVERPGNAYSQRLANKAASSCGRCCVREKGARRPAHGDDSLSRWLATERAAGGHVVPCMEGCAKCRHMC